MAALSFVFVIDWVFVCVTIFSHLLTSLGDICPFSRWNSTCAGRLPPLLWLFSFVHFEVIRRISNISICIRDTSHTTKCRWTWFLQMISCYLFTFISTNTFLSCDRCIHQTQKDSIISLHYLNNHAGDGGIIWSPASDTIIIVQNLSVVSHII